MKAVIVTVWLLVELVAADGIVFTPETEEEANKYLLPKGFLFGAGTSAYQTEGAWNVSGKGVSTLDYFYNIEGRNPDPDYNGNIAADSYHHIDDDIQMIKQLKLQVYRFSISWARLLPDGNASSPNPDGVRYYNEIINKLRAIDVEPMITLYHFDHPQILHVRHDSWLGRGMIEDFVAYADVAFQTFGDRVKYWTTINEANVYCRLVYENNRMGPGNASEPVGARYTCIHNQVLAHGRAYRLYQEKYAKDQGGKIGFTCLSNLSGPNSTSYEDIQASERFNAIETGLCVSPVILGDYPDIAIRQVEKKSKEQNLAVSKLPKFTEEEKAMLKNSVDFLGFNVYFRSTVASCQPGVCDTADADAVIANPPTPGTGIFGNAFTCLGNPSAMDLSLLYVRDSFNNTPIFITENGCEDDIGMHDQNRAVYHSVFLRRMIKIIKEDGVNILGMTVWTLLDDFEWSSAYKPKLGLVHIDFSSLSRTRTLKDSSAFFIKMMTEGRVPLVELTSDELSGSTTPRPTLPVQPTSDATPPASAASRPAWTCCIVVVLTVLIKLIL